MSAEETRDISFSNMEDRSKFSTYLKESGIRPQLVQILHQLYIDMTKPRADRNYPYVDPTKPRADRNSSHADSTKPDDAIVYIQDKLGDLRPRMWEMEAVLDALNQTLALKEELSQQIAGLQQELRDRERIEEGDSRCADSELANSVVYEDFI